MITVQQVHSLIANGNLDSDIFIVEVTVRPGNKIMVLADTQNNITIDQCVSVSRCIEGQLDREIEDFELEVSSPGLLMPFKVMQQYHKNVDKQVEVVMKEGDKYYGRLISVAETSFVVETKQKVKPEGKKKAEIVIEQHTIEVTEVKSTKLVINF